MKTYTQLLVTLGLIISQFGLFAQGGIVITGTVTTSNHDEPVPYATVAVMSAATESIVTGTTTDDNGWFEVQTDSTNIYVDISFIGFDTKTIREIGATNGQVDLGIIEMLEVGQMLDEVEIVAEKSSVEFKLDKRVFNVGKDLTSSGMGALDVLDNVPSVNVDIEGQVSLRGNTGVQILINGKPSVLADEGGMALSTLTADMIESVEVITNPSAKYEAEGTAGIINIVLKKEEKKGFNGSVSVNTGIPHNHSIGVSLNRRTENFNFFTQFGAGYRSLPSYRENINRNLVDGTEIVSDGTEYRNENFYNITLGTDYHINDYNVLTLSGNFAYEVENQPSETDFSIYDGMNMLESQYTRTETTSATNPKYQYDLQYKKQFKSHEDHVLLFGALGSYFGKDQESEFENKYTFGDDVAPGQQTETDFYQLDFQFNLDYTNPITDNITIEAGAAYEINDVGNDYAVYNLNEDNSWIIDSNLTNNFEYVQKVFGVYGTGSYEKNKWGIKLGLRIESTDLRTELVTTNETNKQVFTDFFPSAHASYKVNEGFSMQAGYSRRIFRPRLWDLNPFFNIRNNYNVRTGNPNLQPEYADSYELTGILIFDKASLNASVYHLYTTDVVERVTLYKDDISVTTPANVGTKNQTGFEVNGKYTPAKWFTLNGDFNYGFFFRKGSYEGQSFDFNGTQWTAQLTGRFKLPADIEIELSGDYRSGYETVQGEVSGTAFADIGLRKKFWDGKVVVNLSVRDIFASRIRESFVDQPDFYVYDFSQRGRFFTLGVSYSFGKGEAMQYTGRRR